METINKKSSALTVRFIIRMIWAMLAFLAAFILLFKNHAASLGPDYLAFIAGGVAALLLAHALRLFGSIGGRILIVATLLFLLGSLLVPLESSFLHSAKDFKVFLYLVSAVSDACGLLLVYRSGHDIGDAVFVAPSRRITEAGTAIESLLQAKSPPQTPRNN